MNATGSAYDALGYIKDIIGDFTPRLGLILGSGLNSLAEEITQSRCISFSDIPGFTDTTVAGHKGSLLFGYLGGIPVACLQGRAHYYEGRTHAAIQVPIRTLKLLGCEGLILTNAAASLRREVSPGSLVVISDHINFQFQNPLVGANDDSFGPRFPSLQDAYDPELMLMTQKIAAELGIPICKGVYLATLGPCYETPAEIRAFKVLGADVVGMSTVPEVIIARHCSLKVLAISTITNMACGMSDEFLTHESVLQVANMAAFDLKRLLLQLLSQYQ